MDEEYGWDDWTDTYYADSTDYGDAGIVGEEIIDGGGGTDWFEAGSENVDVTQTPDTEEYYTDEEVLAWAAANGYDFETGNYIGDDLRAAYTASRGSSGSGGGGSLGGGGGSSAKPSSTAQAQQQRGSGLNIFFGGSTANNNNMILLAVAVVVLVLVIRK